MRALIVILCVSALFLSLGNQANAVFVSPDPHHGGSNIPAVGDDRHGKIFESYGMTANIVGNTLTFTLSTDFMGKRGITIDTDGNTQGDVTWQIYYADLLFDTSKPTLTTNPDGSFNMSNFNPDFGVVFALDQGGVGAGYGGTNVAALSSLTVGFYQVSGVLTANQYVDSYTNTSPVSYSHPTSTYNENYYVKIANGSTFISALTSAPVPVSSLSIPTDDIADKTITISFTITDQNILNMFKDGFTAFWGTGTCGNDGVVAVVPVPPSLLLMGSGLISMMGFTAVRRFRSGGGRRKAA